MLLYFFFLFFLNKEEEALEKIIHFFSTTFFLPSFLSLIFFCYSFFVNETLPHTLTLLFATLYIFFSSSSSSCHSTLSFIPTFFVVRFLFSEKEKEKCARQTSHWHRSIVLRKKRAYMIKSRTHSEQQVELIAFAVIQFSLHKSSTALLRRHVWVRRNEK